MSKQVQDQPKKNHFKQPKFGVLRPLGRMTGKIDGQNINYEDLWKHDQHIHDLQFKSLDSEFNDENEEGVSPSRELLKKFYDVKVKNKFTCGFCGFVDAKYIEIHHRDGNHFNNSDSNLDTACILCHRQHHLLWLSLCDHAELGAAAVDYLPQTELNHLQRISFVLNEHPTRAKDLGKDGKLGAMLAVISNGFSRPLHAFMVSDQEKQVFRDEYIATTDLESPFTDFKTNYRSIQGAYAALESRKPTQKEVALLEILDNFIPPIEQNSKPEEHRAKFHNQLKEVLENYEKKLTLAFEQKFNRNKEVFSIFELAVALKDIDYDVYKTFNPPYLKLIFKPTIFSKEQLEYYKKLGYFNTTKWVMHTEGIMEAEQVSDVNKGASNASE